MPKLHAGVLANPTDVLSEDIVLDEDNGEAKIMRIEQPLCSFMNAVVWCRQYLLQDSFVVFAQTAVFSVLGGLHRWYAADSRPRHSYCHCQLIVLHFSSVLVLVGAYFTHLQPNSSAGAVKVCICAWLFIEISSQTNAEADTNDD